MNAIESLFDDPTEPDGDEREEDEDQDDEEEDKEQVYPPPAAAAPTPIRRVSVGEGALPAPDDVAGWKKLGSPVLKMLERGPRPVMAVKLRCAQALPRPHGKPITEQLLEQLERLGVIVAFRGVKARTYRLAAPTPPAAPKPSPPPPPAALPPQPAKEEKMPRTATSPDWLPTKAAAELIGAHASRLSQLLAEKRIESRGERREREWSRASLERYLAEKGKGGPRKSAVPPPETGASPGGREGSAPSGRRGRTIARARARGALAGGRIPARAVRRGRGAPADRRPGGR